MLRLPVHESVVSFAREYAPLSVPARRSAGFAEIAGQRRGDGDVLDLVATLALYRDLGSRHVPCSVEMRAGGGDHHDLTILDSTWNVKSSSYAPVRDGLHLYVKREELSKPLDGYVQVFVHLDEPSDPEPHVHVAGVASADRLRSLPPVEIPKTGHVGVGLSCSQLTPWAALVERAGRAPIERLAAA